MGGGTWADIERPQLSLPSRHRYTLTHRPGSTESEQVTHGDAERQTQAEMHTETAWCRPSDTGPVTQARRQAASSTVSPTQVSHSGHCARLGPPRPALPLHPQPHTQEDGTGTEGWQRGQPKELAQGPAAKRGSQPGGRPLRRGCQGNRLLQNQLGA